MEHAELVFELSSVERMSTQERLQLARRRRRSQLKSWAAREREWLKTKQQSNGSKPSIRFSDNVILLEAASRNDIDEVKNLLTKGVSPDSTNDDGLTALHQCCIDDNEEMMKLLLEFGANVNAEDSERWTPLHAAATCGHLHLVKQLISNGANLLAVNGDGNMPYDICEDDACLEEIEGAMAKNGVTQNIIDDTRAVRETAMLEDLISGDLDLEKPDAQGVSPLHIASANGYMSVVEFLLDHHVATDPKDADGWQPVHAAACWGHIEVLELLVQNGADLNAQTKHDETPAEICEDAELRERIIELRTEQESRKQAEQARRRVRRSQSNNSRAHSVRRTSVRERGLTAKRDAAQEARFRLQAVQIPLGNEQPPPQPLSTEDISDSFPLRREPEGEDSCIEKNSAVDLPTETSYTTESNGKINIHVSVTINAGTLAELKKQRSQNRTIAPDVTSVLSQATLSDMESPQPKRFFGDMSENVVDDSKSKFCCSLL